MKTRVPAISWRSRYQKHGTCYFHIRSFLLLHLVLGKSIWDSQPPNEGLKPEYRQIWAGGTHLFWLARYFMQAISSVLLPRSLFNKWTDHNFALHTSLFNCYARNRLPVAPESLRDVRLMGKMKQKNSLGPWVMISDDFWLILGGPPRWISGSSPIVRSPIYRWENSRIGDLRSPGLRSSYWDDPGMVDMVVVSGRRNQALVFGVVESPAGFLAAHFKVWKAMHSDIDHLAVLDRGMHRKSCLRMGSAKRSRSHLLQIEYPRVI